MKQASEAVTHRVSSMSLIARRAKLRKRKLDANIATETKPARFPLSRTPSEYTIASTNSAANTDGSLAEP